MSHFLQRLMDRHRSDDLGRTVNQQVLPRPKARFENNAGSGAIVPTELNQGSFQASYSDSDNGQNPAHMARNTERILAAPQTRQVVQDVPTPPKQPLVNDTAIQPATARAGMESWNERIESLRLLFEQNSTRPEVLPDVNKSRNAIHQRSGSEIQLTNHHEQSDNQDGTLVNQLNPPIQTILRRLNDPQQSEINAEKTMESQFHPALSSNPERINQLTVKPEATLDFVPPATRREKQRIESRAEKSELSHVELQREPLLFRTDSTSKEKALKPGSASDFSQPVIKEIKPGTENRAGQRESFPSGMLQTPNWLNELQTNLNARWQEINAKETSETVVNITIGRIEVKAAPTSTAQQTKTRAKVTGVMNLDDYLKQRENRGRK